MTSTAVNNVQLIALDLCTKGVVTLRDIISEVILKAPKISFSRNQNLRFQGLV
jgi:hypothetical protein